MRFTSALPPKADIREGAAKRLLMTLSGRQPLGRRVKGNVIVFTDPLHDEEPAGTAIFARHLMRGLGRHGEGLTCLQFVPLGEVQRFHHHRAIETGEGVRDSRVGVPGPFWPLPKVRICTRTSGVSTIQTRSSMT